MARHPGDEAVGIGSRPDRVGTSLTPWIFGDGAFDVRDHTLGVIASDLGHDIGRVAIPIGIRRIAIAADRLAPTDDVVAHPGWITPPLHHEPGVDGENALP